MVKGAQKQPKGEAKLPTRTTRGGMDDASATREVKIYGRHAALAVFAKRPASIIKVYLSKDIAPRLSALMKYCAAERKPYSIVGEDDLDRLTKTQHHEGVCLVVAPRPAVPFDEWLAREEQRSTLPLLVVLDGVENPHNVGAIVRTCAHFGVTALAMSNWRAFENGASAWVARGALEEVDILQGAGLLDILKRAKSKKFSIFTTSTTGGVSVFAKDLWLGPRAVVFGSESQGVSNEVQKWCDATISIPGSGVIDSLNVSVAAGIVLAACGLSRG